MARIMIAGSNDFVSRESRVALETKGYRLKFFSSLQDAVALILEDPPDLLLLEKGFAGDGDRRLIDTAKACLQKANMPILLALDSHELRTEPDWDLFPVDDILLKPFTPEVLLARIRLAESRMIRVFDNNPLSRLPGNTSILRAIQKILHSGADSAVCYVDIDNFKPYNDRYGFSRGDEVILMVARIIVNVVKEMSREDSFVGHVGGDDFVFLVRQDKVEPVCERVLKNFELVRNMFLSGEDIAAGAFVGKDRQDRETRFGLLSLSIAVVTTGGGKYKHYGEVSLVASQVKHYVKKLQGSNYMIDRREVG